MAIFPMVTSSNASLAAELVMPVIHSATVVVPTYNEAENINRLVPELLALPDQLNVIVVDDALPDGTGALVVRP